MSPVLILKHLMQVFINACRLLLALRPLSQFGRGRLSLVAISFDALSLLFGPCHQSEFTLAGPYGMPLTRIPKLTPGGGGYYHIWAIQVCAAVKGMVFKHFTLEQGYKSEHFGLEKGIIFQETDQLVEDFIQTRETATLGQGGFGEFTLVQGSKIQLNQLWYRLRVPGSQRHIPTQKFLKYPNPPPGWKYTTQEPLSGSCSNSAITDNSCLLKV